MSQRFIQNMQQAFAEYESCRIRIRYNPFYYNYCCSLLLSPALTNAQVSRKQLKRVAKICILRTDKGI